MGRPIKILAWVIGGCVALFAVAAIAFFLFFDANDFRDNIAQAVRESTGRELTIEGDVRLQVIPWLAVELGETRLGNAPGFGAEPFARIERAQLSVRLLPLLLQREVVIGTAELDGLRLNLAVDRKGRSNWDDLAPEKSAADETGTSSGGGTLDVSGVDIKDAAIRYADLASGDTYAINDANLHIGRVATQNNTVTVGGLRLQGVVEGIANSPTRLSFATDGIAVQTDEQVISVEPIAMTALGIDIEAVPEPFSYAGPVTPKAAIKVAEFSPRSLMHLLDIEAPTTADPSALSIVAIDADASVQEKRIELANVTVRLDDTNLTGALAVPRSSAGAYHFDLHGDAIDLNRYMAPAEPVDAEAEALPPIKIPADLIRPLKASGKLEIGSVKLANLELGEVVLALSAGNGRLRLHPITAALYGGNYNGDVRIDVAGATPELSLDEKVAGVDLAQLALAMFATQNITGSINGNFKLAGHGNDMAEIRRTLGGSMSLALEDGTYEGTDIWYELRRARALFKQEAPPEPVLPPRTKFSSVTATGIVTNGVLQNDDLVADLPFMEITGRGKVDIAAGIVDYSLRAQVYKKPEIMAGATPEEIDDLTKAVIPLKITGSLASPKVRPDIEALLQQRIKEKIEEKIEDKLGDKLKDLFGK